MADVWHSTVISCILNEKTLSQEGKNKTARKRNTTGPKPHMCIRIQVKETKINTKKVAAGRSVGQLTRHAANERINCEARTYKNSGDVQRKPSTRKSQIEKFMGAVQVSLALFHHVFERQNTHTECSVCVTKLLLLFIMLMMLSRTDNILSGCLVDRKKDFLKKSRHKQQIDFQTVSERVLFLFVLPVSLYVSVCLRNAPT